MLGDRARAGKVFGAALDALDAERDDGRLAARLRLAAARRRGRARARRRGQSAAAKSQGDAIARAGAVARSGARASARITSTQENNWMALAAEALAEHASLEPVHASTASRSRARSIADGAARRSPASRSPSPTPAQTPAQLVVTVSGAPIAPDPAVVQRLCDRAHVLQARRNEDRPARASRRTSASWWRSR